MQNISRELSCRFSNMSLLSAFMVIGIHVLKRHQETMSAAWWLRMLSCDGICRIAVPYFFAAAGFFLAGRILDFRGGYWREVAKRLKTLMLPFFTWCMICFCLCSCLSIVGNFIAHRSFLTGIFSWQRLSISFGVNPFSVPELRQLWFVRVLFVLVLLSPALAFLSKSMLGVVLAILLWFTGKFMAPFWLSEEVSKFINFGFVSLEGIAFFMLGMFVRRRGLDLLKMRTRFIAMLIAGGMFFLLLKLMSDAGLFFSSSFNGIFLGLSILFLMPGVFFLMPKYLVFPKLNGYSFAIYLVHLNVVFVYFAMLCALGTHSYLLYWLDPGISIVGATSCFIVVSVTTLLICNWIRRLSVSRPIVGLALLGGR